MLGQLSQEVEPQRLRGERNAIGFAAMPKKYFINREPFCPQLAS